MNNISDGESYRFGCMLQKDGYIRMEHTSSNDETQSNVNGVAPRADQSAEQLVESGALAFHDRLLERSKKLTKEDLAPFPSDFTENLDHYLYGVSKKTP